MSSEQSNEQFEYKFVIDETISSVSDDENDDAYEDSLRPLRDAVRSQNAPLVRELLKQKPDLQSISGGHILWDAILEDNTEIASMLLRAKADPNVTKPNDNFQSSLLYELGSSQDPRHHELALLAMEYGASANDFEIEYVLCRAIDSGSLRLVEALLRRGTPVRYSIVHQIVRSPRVVELIGLLVGGDFVAEETKYMRAVTTFYQLYVLPGDEDRIIPAVETLLGLGLDVNVVNAYGDVLIYAIRCKKLRTVRLLLEHGIDVNKRGRDGILPLYSAASTQQPEVVEMLLDVGAAIDARSGSDSSPQALHYGQCALHAACKGHQTEKRVLDILLSRGADVNVVDPFRRTPFAHAKFVGVLSDAHRAMIKHFAILDVKGVGFHAFDRKIVEENCRMREFYGECLNELRLMSSINVSRNSTLFSVMLLDARILAFLMRSQRVRHNCSYCRLRNLFPIYYEGMGAKIEAAETLRGAMVDKEQALRDALDDALPYPALENVLFHFYSDASC